MQQAVAAGPLALGLIAMLHAAQDSRTVLLSAREARRAALQAAQICRSIATRLPVARGAWVLGRLAAQRVEILCECETSGVIQEILLIVVGRSRRVRELAAIQVVALGVRLHGHNVRATVAKGRSGAP